MKKYIFVLVILIKFCNSKHLLIMDDDVDESVEEEDNILTHAKTLLTRFQFVMPGTKWCGFGGGGTHKDDLGIFKEVDKCCRDHAYCDHIRSGETRFNLTNLGSFTRFSCSCDENFRTCLHNDSTLTALTVGANYFNVIGTQCYKNEYRIVGCSKRQGLLRRKCIKYTLDTDGEQLYQWFDVPTF